MYPSWNVEIKKVWIDVAHECSGCASCKGKCTSLGVFVYSGVAVGMCSGGAQYIGVVQGLVAVNVW